MNAKEEEKDVHVEREQVPVHRGYHSVRPKGGVQKNIIATLGVAGAGHRGAGHRDQGVDDNNITNMLGVVLAEKAKILKYIYI